MIEEYGRIVGLENGFAWIESERRSSCSSCATQGCCGTGVLAGLLGRRRLRLRAINRIEAGVGEHVVIGLPETGLLYGSLAVYAVPLLALLAGTLAGNALAGAWQPALAEAASIVGAVTGLLAGLVWLQRFSRRNRDNPSSQVVVLRRVHAALPVR